MEEIKNPCVKCTSYWSAGRNCDCSSVCDKYEKYKEYRQKLEKYEKNKYFKEQFKNNIDKLHNKFYDEFDENIPFDQQRIIKKFVDFLKQNV